MTWQTIFELILKDYRSNNGYIASLCCSLCREVEHRKLTDQITIAVNGKLQFLQLRDALIESCKEHGFKVD
jgi:hypothetical protein